MKTTSITHVVIIVGLAFLVMGNLMSNRAAPVSHVLDNATRIRERNAYESTIIWGETTNIMAGDADVSGVIGKLNLIPAALRAGIGIPNSNGVIVLSLHQKVMRSAYSAYELVSTNSSVSKKFLVAFLPKLGEQFVLTMTDTNGVVVPKTPKGLSIGKPDSLKPNTRAWQAGHNDYFYSFMWPDIDYPHSQPLNLTEYFVLEKPGLYKLTFIQRMYVEDVNSCLKAITLPPVTVDVRVEK